MRYTDRIAQCAAGLVRKYKTRDPFELAKELGIHVFFSDEFVTLKGMYFIIKRNRYIYINNKLDDNTKKIVCAHEIGHDRLHRDLAKFGALQEFVLYDMATRQEYEANVFASSVLLEDDAMLELIYERGYDAQQIAVELKSDINLVALKAATLKTKGHRLSPPDVKSDFLK